MKNSERYLDYCTTCSSISKSGKSYKISIDKQESQEKKKLILSCNCKGYVIKKAGKEKTCKHVNSKSLIWRLILNHPEEHLRDSMLDGVGDDNFQHNFSIEDFLESKLDDQGHFIEFAPLVPAFPKITGIFSLFCCCGNKVEFPENVDVAECEKCGDFLSV
jgi:hypothetical protein